MPSAENSNSIWTLVFSLVAVINGLGIVQLLTAFSEFLRRRNAIDASHYWLYSLLAIFQVLMHILFWWQILSLRDADSMNFLLYLYLLVGPTLLFLATSRLIPHWDGERVDLQRVYLEIRKDYYTIMVAFWAWVILVWPVFVGRFPPTVPLLAAFLSTHLVLRFSENLKVHSILVVSNCLLYAAIIAIFAIKMGAVGRAVAQP